MQLSLQRKRLKATMTLKTTDLPRVKSPTFKLKITHGLEELMLFVTKKVKEVIWQDVSLARNRKMRAASSPVQTNHEPKDRSQKLGRSQASETLAVIEKKTKKVLVVAFYVEMIRKKLMMVERLREVQEATKILAQPLLLLVLAVSEAIRL
jgi:hypothetical protein